MSREFLHEYFSEQEFEVLCRFTDQQIAQFLTPHVRSVLASGPSVVERELVAIQQQIKDLRQSTIDAISEIKRSSVAHDDLLKAVMPLHNTIVTLSAGINQQILDLKQYTNKDEVIHQITELKATSHAVTNGLLDAVTTSIREANVFDEDKITKAITPLLQQIAELRHSVIAPEDVSKAVQTAVPLSIMQLHSTLSDIKSALSHVDANNREQTSLIQSIPDMIEMHKSKPKVASIIGKHAEDYVYDILREVFGNVVLTRGQAMNGDMRVEDILLVEVKCYSVLVPVAEYDKFKRDIAARSDVRCALFVSLQTLVGDIPHNFTYEMEHSSSRLLPIATICTSDPRLIKSFAKMLVSHAKLLGAPAEVKENSISTTDRDDAEASIRKLISDVTRLSTPRKMLRDLATSVSTTINSCLTELDALEKTFHTELNIAQHKINSIITASTEYVYKTDTTATDLIATHCKANNKEVLTLVNEMSSRMTLSWRRVNNYLDCQYVKLKFLSTSTSIMIPTNRLSLDDMTHACKVFLPIDGSMSAKWLEIPINSSTLAPLQEYALPMAGITCVK